MGVLAERCLAGGEAGTEAAELAIQPTLPLNSGAFNGIVAEWQAQQLLCRLRHLPGISGDVKQSLGF